MRECADGQVAGGLIEIDAETTSYPVAPEAIAALADDNSPNATVPAFDYHAASIDTARERAAEAGVGDRTSFERPTLRG